MVNPYPSMRISTCPRCERKTGQRKLPLLIHVAPAHLIVLNYTCRFCHACDMLVAHKREVEHLLTELFRSLDPDSIGNDYLTLGTVEKDFWRESVKQPATIEDTLAHASDFKEYYKELRVTQTGWFRADVEPPIWEPPPSEEWVKER